MSVSNVERAHVQRLEGIKRYAEADASDPFALARCMLHLRQGICNRKVTEKGEVTECDYNAQRDPNGGWSSRVRP